MFIPEEKIHLKNKCIIGLSNFQKQDLTIFKKSMSKLKQNICQIDYIDINSHLIELRVNLQREKASKKDGKIGMISKDWLNKYQNEIPCVIIQIIDITFKIIESKDPALISEDIIVEISKLKSVFNISNYILIIKNLYNLNKSNFDSQIRNNILNNVKYLKDKNVIIINDNNQFENIQFVDNLTELVKEEINAFFFAKKNEYFYKYEKCKQKKEIEYTIKYLIKLFSLSYITHKDNVNYSYLFKANLYLRQKIDKKNYKFICNFNNNNNINSIIDIKKRELINQIITYFEIKNISDYIIYYISLKKNMTENEINKFIYNHLSLFDINNFIEINNLINLNNKNNDNNDFELYYKYLFIFNLIWKISWFINKDNIIYKKSQEKINNLLNSNMTFNTNIINYYLLNNLLRLYDFVNKEKNFIENNIINKYKNYKYDKIINKYIEKLPTFFEIDDNGNKKNDINLEESIIIYMNIFILNNNNILDSNFLYQKLQSFFASQNYSAYLFNIVIKFNLIDSNTQSNKANFIKNSLSYLNNDVIVKFPKINEIYLDKLFNLFVKDETYEKDIEQQNKIEIILKYLSILKKTNISKDESNLINDIINKKNDNNNTYNFNINNNNHFLDLKIIYKNKEISNESNNLLVRPFDCLNIAIYLSIKKEEIFLDVEKIQIFFNSEMNSTNYIEKNNYKRNYKEIDISNKISKNNSISVNFNHFIKNTSYHYFFIDNIKIILKNKNIININNIKINNNIILYNKNNNEEKILQIIANNKNVLRLGEKENFLHSIKYQKIIDNDNIIISEVSGKIELKNNENENENEVKQNNEIKKKYYLKNIKEESDSSTLSNTIDFQVNSPFNDKDMHSYHFIIKINKIGEYFLFYKLKFKIMHKECNDESYIFEENGKILIECLNPFGFRTKLESSLYLISKKDNQKTFPKNYPMKYDIFLTNYLDKKMIIKNIIFESLSNYIKIHSPFLKINSKKEKKICLSKGDKFIIPSKLFINENIESSIGVLKIIWISYDLNDFEQQKLYNETIIELNKIVTKDINFKIEGNFIYEKNNRIDDCLYYQLKIKNLNNYSTLLTCKLLNEKNNLDKNIEDINKIDIITYGKAKIKDIILPKKELIFLFLFYDVNKIKNNNNEKVIVDSRYKRIIQINEYNLDNINQKEPFTDLINQIFFIPELYSQFDKN